MEHNINTRIINTRIINTRIINTPTDGEREDERFFGDGQGHDTGQGQLYEGRLAITQG